MLKNNFARVWVCLLVAWLYAGQLLGQDLSVNYRNLPLEEVIADLKHKTNYDFVYKKELLKEVPPITVKLENTRLADILTKVLLGTGLDYDLVNNTVILRRIKEFTDKNKRKISGRVYNEHGELLPGVTIRIKGTEVGTITDVDGQFSLMLNSANPILVLSFVGMKTKELAITSKIGSYIDVQLLGEVTALEETVITGYQQMNRRESASAITTLKAKDVLAPGYMSLNQMLQGKIPGMSIMLQSGEPSSTPTIRIRGNSTINGNKAPVWVVDGVIMPETIPFSASDLNSPDAAYLIGSSISGLSPQDIESISVLKDASATAIYGVKAANGVIVITTKKGTVSAPSITYDAAFNLNTAPSYEQFDLMNSQERVALSKEIYDARLRYQNKPIKESYEGALMRLLSKEISQEEFAALVRKYETNNTDWFGHLFRYTVSQNHNLSVNGGSEKMKYYTSVSYNQTPGIAQKSLSNRFTGMGKFSFQLNKIFDIEAKMDISSQTNKGYYDINPFTYAFQTSRTLPLYNEDGSPYYYVASGVNNLLSYNVQNELNQTGRESRIRRMGALFNLKARILDGLTYTGTVSYYWTNTHVNAWATEQSYKVSTIRQYAYGAYEPNSNEYNRSELPKGGVLSQSHTENRSYMIRNTLNYTGYFKDQHFVNLFAGIEMRADKYDGNNLYSYGWDPHYGQSISPIYTNRYVERAKSGMFEPKIVQTLTQVASYIGSASYTFKDTYTLNANIRSDGANKFDSNPKYRWLPTWSVAGKWIVSNERFMKPLTWVDDLSLRLSYGIQGNIHDDATPYLIVGLLPTHAISGLRPANIHRLPNPDLRWEKTRSYNIGIDYSFLQRRVNLTLDYYQKRTTDLITDLRVSPVTGRTFMYMNAGDAVNKGIEGAISVDAVRNKSFDWNISANFSHNTNEIRYAFDAALTGKELYKNKLRGNVAMVGQPLGTIYSFQYAGLSSANGYPLFYATDGRKVHDGDYEVMSLLPSGSIYPDLSGGFDTRLTYKKNLSVAVGFSYQLGGVKRLPAIYSNARRAFDPARNLPRAFVEHWRQPGDEQHTDVPALYDTRIADSFPSELKALYEENNATDVNMIEMYDQSNLRVAKSDFLRLRNITVSYRLPQTWVKRMNLREVTLRLQGSNLKTWAPKAWNGLDPETAYANMPLMPSYSVGINILL